MKICLDGYGIIDFTKTKSRCLLCGVQMPKSMKSIEEHIQGKNHKKHLEISNKNAMYFKDNALHCKLCQGTLTIEDCTWEHIMTRTHRFRMTSLEYLTKGQFMFIKSFMCDDHENVHCKLCNTNFEFSLDNIELHTFSIGHRRNLIAHLKPLNGLFASKNNKLWCKICKSLIHDNVKSIWDHIESYMFHKQWLGMIEMVTANQNVSFNGFLLNESETNAHCNRCNVDFKCSSLSIKAHVSTRTHIEGLRR